MPYRYVKPEDVQGKTVLLRADLNEPLDNQGNLADDFRIQAILPTVSMLLARNAKVIIVAHLGRPQVGDRSKLTLKPAASKLAQLLKLPLMDCEQSLEPEPRVAFCNKDLTEVGSIEHIRNAAQNGPVILENIRFYSEEETNDETFASQLAKLADVYVNDAFAACHRTDASLVAVTKFLPSFAGPLIAKEVKNLSYISTNPKHPFVLIMGGIKIAEKAKTLEYLGKRADHILIGGGIANLIFAAKEFEIGLSEASSDDFPVAWRLINNFKSKLILPRDVIVDSNGKAEVRQIYEIKPNETVMDIGPKTMLTFAGVIKQAQSVCWNGPLGCFEKPAFRAGTMGIAQLLGGIGTGKAFVVAGGGETVNAIRMAGQEKHIDHLSTGGGAMLEYLAGNKLPGLGVLEQ